MMNDTRAFSVIELLVGTMIFAFLLAFSTRFLTLAVHGSVKGTEAVSYVQAAAALFKAVDEDFQGLLPSAPLNLGDEMPTGGIRPISDIIFAPDAAGATSIGFWKIHSDADSDSFRFITYEYDRPAGEVVRCEKILRAGNLVDLRTNRLGAALVRSFRVTELPTGPERGPQVELTAGFQGREHAATYTRILATPLLRAAREIRGWSFLAP